ncbi:MAG TPA: ATP-binding cassette domain-containing protein [Jiangellaceae bacterium]
MPTERELAVEAKQLRRSFGSTQAVDGVDLRIERGSVCGVLGPNGAGKTTLIRMLATLLRPDAGTARVCGYDVVREAEQVRSRVSLTGQFAAVDGDLTGVENLVLIGRLLGLSRPAAKRRAHELLDGFELASAAGRLLRTYSGGMRRRLDVAASLVTPPEVLFLDEPTTGLDPRSRHDVWDIVRALTGAGTTVLLTTQYLTEADELADRIAVLNQGTVIAEGTPAELKASVGGGRLRVRVRDPQQRPAAQLELSRALRTDVQLDGDTAGLVARTGDADRAAAAVAELPGAGIAVADFAHDRPTLDEVFFALTGTEREVSS